MRRALAAFSIAILACGCGGRTVKPHFEGNPDWVGRASGVFPAPLGAGKIEGIAAGDSQDKADAAACAEAVRVLARRLVAMLPATEDASTIPPLKLAGQRVISRWQRPEGGASWSLCVLDRSGVEQSLNATLMSPKLRDFMSVQVDHILSK